MTSISPIFGNRIEDAKRILDYVSAMTDPHDEVFLDGVQRVEKLMQEIHNLAQPTKQGVVTR